MKRKRHIARDRESGEALVWNDAPVLGLNADEDRELALLKNERIDRIEEALEHLAAEQRQCVKLFFLEQKSYQEVSAITGFTLKQVKSYIQNGKRNIKINVLQNGHEQKRVRYGS